MQIATFTGNRPQFLVSKWDYNHPFVKDVKDNLRKFFQEKRIERLNNGVALGGDTWAFEVALELNIPVWAFRPCEEQADKWSWSDKKKYKELLVKAERVITVCNTYSSDCFKIRNYAMVDSDTTIVCALCDPAKSDGGTVQTMTYARGKGILVFNIWPGLVEEVVLSPPSQSFGSSTDDEMIEFR